MKADLVTYSHTVDIRGQCMSESLMLRHNLDFSSCKIMVGFCTNVIQIFQKTSDVNRAATNMSVGHQQVNL